MALFYLKEMCALIRRLIHTQMFIQACQCISYNMQYANESAKPGSAWPNTKTVETRTDIRNITLDIV